MRKYVRSATGLPVKVYLDFTNYTGEVTSSTLIASFRNDKWASIFLDHLNDVELSNAQIRVEGAAATTAATSIKASVDDELEIDEIWDRYDPYDGKTYYVSDIRGNIKKTSDPSVAIESWFKMQGKCPMSVDIQTKKKADAVKLTDFVVANPDFIYDLASKYKIPYKPDWIISESEKKSADGQKYFYENEYGDSIHPFGVG